MLVAARERLGEELFRRVAGPDAERKRDRIHGTPGPRLFDPDSPIDWVHGDAAMFVGGIRALLLQSLHPKAMTAVAEHSGYQGDMWGRLARTSTFIATTTFGTVEHADRMVDAVRRVHERVVGTMPDGSAYAASDPHLLAWVHAAEIDSFLAAHTVYGARELTAEQRDRYVAQAGEIASRLGVLDPPRCERDLRAVLAAYRPELAGTDHAREAVRFLILHPDLPLAARPPYLTLVAAAVGLMPAWTRVPLRLPYLPVTERTVVRVLGSGAVRTIRWAMAPGREHARLLELEHTLRT